MKWTPNKFPKNLIESIIFIIILTFTAFLVIGGFEFFAPNSRSFHILALRDFLSYFFCFILLSFLSKKVFSRYNFKVNNYKIFILLIFTSLIFSVSVVIPSYYSLSNINELKIDLNTTNTDFAFLFITIALIPAIFEELIVRGILFDQLLKSNSLIKSIAITSIIFGIIHMSIAKLPSLILASIFICLVYYKTKNLLFAIVIHFFINLTSIYEQRMIKENIESITFFNIYGKHTLFVLLISYLILGFLLYLLYKALKKQQQQIKKNC